MMLDLDKWKRVQAGTRLRFFISAQVQERGILRAWGSGRYLREMDEDVCSVSRTPAALGFVLFLTT